MTRRAALPAVLLVGALLAGCAPGAGEGLGLDDPLLPPGPLPLGAPADGLPPGALPPDALPEDAAPPAPVAYRPEALGADGACYYVETPEEVQALVDAGLCPAGTQPEQAPLPWLQTYHGYYSSAAYYGAFVPVALRAGWSARRTAFGTRYAPAVRAAAPRGRWTGSDGAAYDGATVATRQGFGAGTPRQAEQAAPRSTTAPRSAPRASTGSGPGASAGSGTTGRTAPRSGPGSRPRRR